MQRIDLNQHFSAILKLYFSCECTARWTGQNWWRNKWMWLWPMPEWSSFSGVYHPWAMCMLVSTLLYWKILPSTHNPCDPLTDPCRNNSTCLSLVDGNHYCMHREGKSLFFLLLLLFSMDDDFLIMGERTPKYHWGMWEYLTLNASI